jgi:hypothetical protein
MCFFNILMDEMVFKFLVCVIAASLCRLEMQHLGKSEVFQKFMCLCDWHNR